MIEWDVAELARRAGITTRTLRHYDQIGLLAPSRVTAAGVRHYDSDAVARLQRILLLRDVGMPLAQIAELLEHEDEVQEVAALEDHIRVLKSQRAAVEVRITAVRHLLEARRNGREPDPDILLEGFNDRYEAEVVQRWGREAYEAGNRWWHGKTLSQQQEWKRESEQLVADWVRTFRSGVTPGSTPAREMTKRHIEWLSRIPGTPTHAGDHGQALEMITGLAHMYVEDPGLRHAFGGEESSRFVRDALLVHAADLLQH
ncbi:MAG: MerR family transcriptional regulator [Arachnia propionica]|uniref:MerR family transcriptional regulator n=1 Tax=Arachnia propionica TaxID=1750 RepID=UPI0026FC6B73|nr:MerR family transcriptional regulator [Arachnia propionica]